MRLNHTIPAAGACPLYLHISADHQHSLNFTPFPAYTCAWPSKHHTTTSIATGTGSESTLWDSSQPQSGIASSSTAVIANSESISVERKTYSTRLIHQNQQPRRQFSEVEFRDFCELCAILSSTVGRCRNRLSCLRLMVWLSVLCRVQIGDCAPLFYQTHSSRNLLDFLWFPWKIRLK